MNIVAALGRRKSVALAAMLPVAILVPGLGRWTRPLLEEAVVLLLVVAFIRLNTALLKQHLARPGLIVGSAIWTVLVIPLVIGMGFQVSGFQAHHTDLHLGFMLQLLASPMMATPAIAAILGLDATLVLASLITCSALMPITASILVALLDLPIRVSPLQLGGTLAMILAGSALIGLTIRKLLGVTLIARFQETLDGINLLALFVFLCAVMGDVGIMFIQRTGLVVWFTLLAFAVFCLMFWCTQLVFRWAGKEQAMALALMTAQRNMGLMIAATGTAIPEITWLYFALSQLPTYLAPQLLHFARRKSAE